MTSIAPSPHNLFSKASYDWITPKWLIDRLGPFDLDPCANDPQPWPCAERSYTPQDNGLLRPWFGFVFCNPPYGRQLYRWLDRMSLHGNGIALSFSRTDTKAFFKSVWPRASRLLFLEGRITFHLPDGSKSLQGHNSGGPSVLIGYGPTAAERLESCRDLGAVVEVRRG